MHKRILTALIVLAALGFGLLAGAHPCSAWQERNETPAAAASCHGGMKTEPGAPEHAGVPSHERDSSKGCGTSCHHVCHMTALTEATPVAFTMAPVAQAVIEADGPGLALFVPPIDHIPLA
jgi:hypothetical protein